MSEMNWTDNTRTRATLDRPANRSGNGAGAVDMQGPRVADERSAQVDDKRVIERTQPARSTDNLRARMRDRVQHATEAARGRVAQAPLSSTAMAAVGGAALTALAMLMGARLQQTRPSPVHAGLRRIRAAIR